MGFGSISLERQPDESAKLQAGGALYIPRFVSRIEHSGLINAIDRSEWSKDLPRRTQQYGFRYEYDWRKWKDNPTRLTPAPAIPEWMGVLIERVLRLNIFRKNINQVIVNDYVPGQGIMPHTDFKGFGDVIASLSLCGDTLMRIFPHPTESDGDRDVFDIVLERGSLLVLTGDSRWKWRHGIIPAKHDIQGNVRIPRSRRISITLRTYQE